jgi:hypothetical protein
MWLLLAAMLAGMVVLAGTYTALAGPPPSARPGQQLSGSSSAVPAWSSGWVAIAQGETRTFTHALGLDPNLYAVELWFLDNDDGWGINRRYYGGVEDNGQYLGADWERLTSNTIQVSRLANDTAADKVRVMVWVPSTRPDYDSGWVGINPGENQTFNHNLGVAADDLTVSLWFSGTSGSPPFGIHQIAYGSKSIAGSWVGANWHHLTNNSVQVVRRANDPFVAQVRVLVSHADPPAYDSGWRTIQQAEALTLTHALNWSPDMLIARGECRDLGLGIHQFLAGGNHSPGPVLAGWHGANLQNLTSNTVTIFRWDNDTVCPQVRVRITERSYSQAIPIVVRE